MEFDKIIKSLTKEIEYAKENYVPIIRDKSAKFLYDYVKENNIKNILEIGTAIGFSGSIMLGAGAEKLTTIEIKDKYYNIAKATFEKIGFKDRIQMYLGDAKNIIKDLVDSNDTYDMIFLDGAKGQYLYYLPDLTKLMKSQGVIFADNVLLQGMVEGADYVPHKKRTMVVNLRKYLKIVSENPYETELVRIEDGIAITKYKGE